MNFKCVKCGSNEPVVEKQWWVWSGPSGRKLAEKFLLDDYHHFAERLDNDILDRDYDRDREDDDHDETTVYDDEIDEDSIEFYVRCGGCDREVEFGWSHEDRGGRIWPAECDDFNPWKCHPEPRFRATWAQKGWLRPERPHRVAR